MWYHYAEGVDWSGVSTQVFAHAYNVLDTRNIKFEMFVRGKKKYTNLYIKILFRVQLTQKVPFNGLQKSTVSHRISALWRNPLYLHSKTPDLNLLRLAVLSVAVAIIFQLLAQRATWLNNAVRNYNGSLHYQSYNVQKGSTITTLMPCFDSKQHDISMGVWNTKRYANFSYLLLSWICQFKNSWHASIIKFLFEFIPGQ